ncbi:MAG: acylphosphatase [bacterium]
MMQSELPRMADRALHIKIEGQVQGVGYRFFAMRMAERLNLKGYVRNLPDGNVEVLAEGKEERLMEFLEDLRRGPSYSDVRGVRVTWKEPESKFNSFIVMY